MNPTTTPKHKHQVTILSSHHSVIINQSQIDIVYLFQPSELQIFVDGHLIQSRTFHPGRVAINYLNLIEIAEHIYSNFVQDVRGRSSLWQ